MAKNITCVFVCVYDCVYECVFVSLFVCLIFIQKEPSIIHNTKRAKACITDHIYSTLVSNSHKEVNLSFVCNKLSVSPLLNIDNDLVSQAIVGKAFQYLEAR